MKSFNVDPVLLWHVSQGSMPTNTPVGRGLSAQGAHLVGFVGTDIDSGEITRSDDGKRVKINIRTSRHQGPNRS